MHFTHKKLKMKDSLTFVKHQLSIFKFSFPLALDKLLIMEFNISCGMSNSGHRSFLVSGDSHEEIKYPLKQFWVQIMTHMLSPCCGIALNLN